MHLCVAPSAFLICLPRSQTHRGETLDTDSTSLSVSDLVLSLVSLCGPLSEICGLTQPCVLTSNQQQLTLASFTGLRSSEIMKTPQCFFVFFSHSAFVTLCFCHPDAPLTADWQRNVIGRLGESGPPILQCLLGQRMQGCDVGNEILYKEGGGGSDFQGGFCVA